MDNVEDDELDIKVDDLMNQLSKEMALAEEEQVDDDTKQATFRMLEDDEIEDEELDGDLEDEEQPSVSLLHLRYAFLSRASSRVVAAGSGVAGRSRSSACLCFPESGRVLAFFSHSSLELDPRPPRAGGPFCRSCCSIGPGGHGATGSRGCGQVSAHAIRAI